MFYRLLLSRAQLLRLLEPLQRLPGLGHDWRHGGVLGHGSTVEWELRKCSPHMRGG